MASLSKPALDRLVTYLKDDDRTEPSLKDVITLAELTAESLQAFYARFDREVYSELVEIARYITGMRREIAALGVDDLKSQRLPAAGHELDQIVRSTEEATNTIMSCAEALLGADASDPGCAELVQDNALRILEACAFQDLTGQRIAKVVETLQAIEARVARFAAAVRVEDLGGPADESEDACARRKRALLLNGPQAKGVAIEQAAVDALLANTAADQSAIDKLFA
jgi:chemotaxis protein CheZ